MDNGTAWIDVSATISDGMVHWPTDPPVQVTKADTIGEKGAVANVTCICTSAHVGTHIDAPLHFFKDGKDVASIDINTLIGPTKVFQITDPEKISYDEVSRLEIHEGDRVLFRTRNSDTDWETEPFNKNYVYLEIAAAAYLVERQVTCIGVDYLSIGDEENDPEIHRIILGASVIIIEGLKLKDITTGEYDMICMPLKIKNSDGGPARVALRKR